MHGFEARTVATASAILLWLALNALVAVPRILDPPAIGKMLPLYLGGVLIILEPLFFFLARYQYRFLLRARAEPQRGGDRDA